MTGGSAQHRPGWASGLPARLLALTALFVIVSEILIYVPSIARFRHAQLEEHVARAHIAVLALEATPDNMVSPELERDLLFHASAYSLLLTTPERRIRMLGTDHEPAVDASYDLRGMGAFDMIYAAFVTLTQGRNRILRIIANSPRVPADTIEIVIDEAPLRAAMLGYSRRIVQLTVIISLLTAGLVYLSLHRLLVRPMLRISDSMMRFRANPDDERAIVVPSARRDEIGLVERELQTMQHDLRAALRQKTRLAALGGAVAKINHDLRNTLATAVLASDRLTQLSDPEVRRVAPKLYDAIDRAVALCARTLTFARDDQPSLQESRFPLKALVAEVAASLPTTDGASGSSACTLEYRGADLDVDADRDQLFRVFSNLALNAAQAGARRITVRVRSEAGGKVIDIEDDGPGIAETLQPLLFQPFAGSGRNGGSGLGLLIAREIICDHGGDLLLLATGAEGTTFRIAWPPRRTPRGARARKRGKAAETGEKGLRRFAE